MSGNNPPNRGQSGWQRGPSPSPILYRPPSPWTAAPSPPPIISGPRHFIAGSVGGPPLGRGSPMSPTGFASRSQPMSPSIGSTGLRGTRAGTNPLQQQQQQQQQQQYQHQQQPNIPYPRPQWPPQIQTTPQYQSQPIFQSSSQTQQSPQFRPLGFRSMISPSPPPTIGGVNGPRPYRPIHSYSPGPTSSFQLSPTPSPIVCQMPPEYLYAPPIPQLPNSSQLTRQQQQQEKAIYRPYERPLSRQQSQPPPSVHQQYPAGGSYDFSDGVPEQPPYPKSYIIYDDEEESGPTTAEIIANQSQDYVDEKLAEYQMTILQLQGE